jgi:hypothetical protein
MKLVDSDICDYYNDVDTLIHRFTVWPVVQNFWKNFSTWWRQCSAKFQNISEKNIILGFYAEINYALNKCILLAKRFIHVQKCAKKPISFFVFKILLKQNIAMERFILQKNKTTHIYEDRWTHIENMI